MLILRQIFRRHKDARTNIRTLQNQKIWEQEKEKETTTATAIWSDSVFISEADHLMNVDWEIAKSLT
jgi:hypothetical protein